VIENEFANFTMHYTYKVDAQICWMIRI